MDGADSEMFERSLRHATMSHTGAGLDAALEELGWGEALEADPCTAVSVLFELQGRANATSSALDRVMSHMLAGAGTVVLLPRLGSWTLPGVIDGDHVVVSGLGSAALVEQETVLVGARKGEKDLVVRVAVADLAVRQVGGMDPWLGLVEVTGEATATEGGPVDWPAAASVAQLAIGYELVGASRRMLELASEHARERIQFDRPIGGFQSIRHRLAETLVAIETSAAALEAAWLDRMPETAAMAKALAGRGARITARHCQQVLAGIGFTTEHSLHRYIRRVFVLDELFGAARTLTRELGGDLLRTLRLPPMPAL